MKKRTAEEFEAQAKARFDPDITVWWDIRQCSICESPIGYIFLLGQVGFDGACDCARGPIRLATWQDVADHYNRQIDAVVVAQYDEFWGFAPVVATDGNGPKQKLPDCPRCGLDELWVVSDETSYRLRCYHCGLDAGKRAIPAGESLDESITKIVAVIAALYAKMAEIGAWKIR